MGKRFSIALGFGALLVALSASPASAASELDSCLQGDALICQFDGASIGDFAGAEAALQGTGAKVAVVPESDSVSASLQASQIADASGVSELILVIDGANGDSFGVYSASGKTTAVSEALYGAGVSDGGEAIASVGLSLIYDAPEAGGATADAGGSIWLPVLVSLLSASVLAVVGVKMLRRRDREDFAQVEGRPTAKALAAQKSVELSEDLRRELSSLTKTMEDYGRSSEPQLQSAAGLIQPVHSHIYELFSRIDRKNSKQNREIAQVRYLDTFKKLNSALSKDYFEDIVRNPGLWEDSNEKVAAVLSALRSVDRQIIENIKQVNSSKELEFRLAVDSLIGTEEISVEEAYGEERNLRGHFLP